MSSCIFMICYVSYFYKFIQWWTVNTVIFNLKVKWIKQSNRRGVLLTLQKRSYYNFFSYSHDIVHWQTDLYSMTKTLKIFPLIQIKQDSATHVLLAVKLLCVIVDIIRFTVHTPNEEHNPVSRHTIIAAFKHNCLTSSKLSDARNKDRWNLKEFSLANRERYWDILQFRKIFLLPDFWNPFPCPFYSLLMP